MVVLYYISVWLHILSAAVWIGGTVFLILVLVPMVRRSEYRSIGAAVIHWTGMRFRWVGWLCLSLLLLTGIFNLAYRGRLWDDTLDVVFTVKLFFFIVIFILSALHDFSIGPRATSLWQENPGSSEGIRLRRKASRIGRLNLILGLVMVALGIVLVRGTP